MLKTRQKSKYILHSLLLASLAYFKPTLPVAARTPAEILPPRPLPVFSRHVDVAFAEQVGIEGKEGAQRVGALRPETPTPPSSFLRTDPSSAVTAVRIALHFFASSLRLLDTRAASDAFEFFSTISGGSSRSPAAATLQTVSERIGEMSAPAARTSPCPPPQKYTR